MSKYDLHNPLVTIPNKELFQNVNFEDLFLLVVHLAPKQSRISAKFDADATDSEKLSHIEYNYVGSAARIFRTRRVPPWVPIVGAISCPLFQCKKVNFPMKTVFNIVSSVPEFMSSPPYVCNNIKKIQSVIGERKYQQCSTHKIILQNIKGQEYPIRNKYK